MQIQRYLLVQMATSVVVGVATGLAFYALGLNNAAVWGVAAGITNLVPYVGAVVVGVGSAVGRLHPVRQHRQGAAHRRQLVRDPRHRRQPADAVVDRSRQPDEPVRGVRRRARCSAGCGAPSGLILGMPILMVVKAVCDRVDELKPVGELLGA